MFLPSIGLLCIIGLTQGKEISCPEVTQPPIIDGKIHDDCWKDATRVTDFFQIYPSPGKEAANRTVVYLCYDQNNLYVAFECHTPNGKICAKETVRDREVVAGKDETVGIDIDANYDRSTCFSMFVTPLNAQSDGKSTKNGEEYFIEWDGIWKSQSIKTSYGWSTELSIPFKTIEAEGDKFGINFTRMTFGDNGTPHIYIWCASLTSPEKISTFGTLKGLTDMDISKKLLSLSIVPYGTLSWSEQWKKNIGFDINYVILRYIKGSVTTNPDFAQIESDVDEIDLEKVGIILPEKRLFFQNELYFFQTPITLFYTRSFLEIDYGSNLKFVKSRYSFNSFLVNLHKENYLVGRGIAKVLESSEIGCMAIMNEALEKLISFDGHIAFPWDIWVRSQTTREFQKGNNAYYIGAQRSPNFGLSFNLFRKYIDPAFVIERGFVPFTDFVQNYADLGYSYLTQKSLIPFIFIDGIYDHWEDTKGKSLKDEHQVSIGSTFRGNTTIALVFGEEHRSYQGEWYDNQTQTVVVSSSGERGGIVANYMRGKYYGGDLDYIKGNIDLGLGQKITLSLGAEYQNIDYGEGVSTEDLISVLKCNYRILPKLTWRTFLQWSDLSKEFDANFLLGYEFFTGSHIFLVWNEKRDLSEFGEKNVELPLIDRRLFFKICYQFII